MGGFITLAVGAALLPEVVRRVQLQSNSHFSLPKAERFEKMQRQSYFDYVKERLAVERLMK